MGADVQAALPAEAAQRAGVAIDELADTLLEAVVIVGSARLIGRVLSPRGRA
jgi:hypothetical protein